MVRVLGENDVYAAGNGSAYRLSSIAELSAFRQTIMADGQVVEVLGYYEPGDGGGGIFTYDESSVLAGNGGTIIAPDTGRGRWIRNIGPAANVRWFGALGDGTTDDSEAFQKAVAAYGCAYIPTGEFCIKDVDLTQNLVEIFGDGPGSVLKSIPVLVGSNYYSQNLFTATTDLDSVVFHDLSLDGAGTGTGAEVSQQTLILLDTVKAVRFENVSITKYSAGWDGSTNAIKDWLFYAVVIRYAVSVDFINVLLHDNNYEQLMVYNGPDSDCITTALACREINTGASPASHSALTTFGGHANVSACFFLNTAFSTVSIQLPRSASVTNNCFYDMKQQAVGVALDFGQGAWGPNNNLNVCGNKFRNSDEAAISAGWCNNATFRDNIMEFPGGIGIKIFAELDASVFASRLPDWTLPTLDDSHGITLDGNTVSGVNNVSSTLGYAFRIAHSDSVSGLRVRDVTCTNNQVIVGTGNNNTFYAFYLDGLADSVFSDNWMNYTQNAFRIDGPMENLKICDGNTFAGDDAGTGHDIIFTGVFVATAVEVSRNTFLNYSMDGAFNLVTSAGYTISGLLMLDNLGINPRNQVSGVSNAVLRNTRNTLLTDAPAAGLWAVNDVGLLAPQAGKPEKYICTVAGSYTAQTGNATGTVPNYFFTASVPSELIKGSVIRIAGAGLGATNLTAAVVSVDGSTVNIDTAILTNVAGAALTVVNPTFIKTANMA